MPRKNPDKAVDLIKAYSKEIVKYPEGEKELLELFVGERDPRKIMALPPGPDRSARLAQLIGDLKELARELAESGREHERSIKATTTTTGKAKNKRKTSDLISKENGKFEGFSYTIGMRKDGYFLAKINRKGRNVIEDERAPKIYNNSNLVKLFHSRDEAEFAVRRVINTALVWYAERGVKMREKGRVSKKSKGSIIRRTVSERESLSQQESEERVIAARKKAAEARRQRIRTEKIEGAKRRVSKIPLNNPSGPFSFTHSESAPEKQAEKSFKKFVKYRDKWKESLEDGKPNFGFVIKAYDALENARANLVLAGQSDKADKVDLKKVELRKQMVDLVNNCAEMFSERDFE